MIAAHRLSATGGDEVVHDAATAAKHKLVLLGGGGCLVQLVGAAAQEFLSIPVHAAC